MAHHVGKRNVLARVGLESCLPYGFWLRAGVMPFLRGSWSGGSILHALRPRSGLARRCLAYGWIVQIGVTHGILPWWCCVRLIRRLLLHTRFVLSGVCLDRVMDLTRMSVFMWHGVRRMSYSGLSRAS